MKASWLLFFLPVQLLIAQSEGGRVNLAWEECALERVRSSPGSQAVLTGLLPLRTRALRGGCGLVDPEGVEALEALRWAFSLLNKEYGSVFEGNVSSSYIPGVEIGLDAFDSCQDGRLRLQALGNQFKDLYSPADNCFFNTTRISLGVLDLLGSQETSSVKTAQFLNEFKVPIFSNALLKWEEKLDSVIPISADISLIAETMVGSSKELGWEAVTVVYSSDNYGKEGKTELLDSARRYGLCVSHMETLGKDLEAIALSLENQTSSAVLVFAPLEESAALLKAYSRVGKRQKQWLFSSGVGLFTNKAILELPLELLRGVFSADATAPLKVPEFQAHWDSLVPANASIWYRELFQQTFRCNLPGSFSSGMRRAPCSRVGGGLDAQVVNPLILPVLDTAFGVAVAMKQAWTKKCRGPGLCPQLVQMTNAEYLEMLSGVTFEYGKDIRSPPSLYGRRVNFRKGKDKVMLYQAVQQGQAVSLSEILEFGSGGRILRISKPIFYQNTDEGLLVQSSTSPPAICQLKSGCKCLEQGKPAAEATKPTSSDYSVANGDVLLGVVVPIHHSGAKPYGCGGIIANGGYSQAEAFWYALNNLNGKEGPFGAVLKGVELGGVILDSCQSSARASYLLSQLLMGSFGEYEVEGVIGGQENTASLSAQALLPHIAFSAEDIELADLVHYPFSVQTVVSDTQRLDAVLSLLDERDWRFVHLLYSSSRYGSSLQRRFKAEAATKGICVASSMMITTDSAQLTQVAAVMSGKPEAKLVVVFAEEPELRALFAAMKTGSSEQFVYLIPKHWGPHSELVKGLEDVANQAITFRVPESANPSFQYYSEVKSVPELIEKPWGRELVETTLNCRVGVSCQQNLSLANISSVYNDPGANNLINSVYAFGFALHAVLQQYCGSNYDGLCPAYKALEQEERSSLLLSSILALKFRDESGQIFSFTDHRDAGFPLEIFAHLNSDSSSLYEKIGTYPAKPGQLIISTASHHTGIESVCRNRNNCPMCWNGPFLEANPTTIATTTPSPVRSKPAKVDTELSAFVESEDDIVIGGLFPIHSAGASSFECGKLNEDGVLMLEAFLWAVDTINQNPQLVRGMKIGALGLDSCSSRAHTLGSLENLFEKQAFTNVTSDKVLGFINSPKTSIALAATEVFKDFQVTNIGPDSPSHKFDNIPFNLRASVPLSEQLNAMLSLLQQLNWDFVSVLYSEEEIGADTLLGFRKRLQDSGVCIALEKAVTTSKNTEIVDQLSSAIRNGSRAILLLTNQQETAALLRGLDSAIENGALESGDFTLLMRTGWDEKKQSKAAVGSIALQYDAQPLSPFKEHLNQLALLNNSRNPWWEAYLMEKKLGCFPCPQSSVLIRNGLPQLPILANIVNGVFALAVGLGNLQQEYCRGETGFCPGLRAQKDLRNMIFSHVRNVAFSRGDSLNETFEFGLDGWGYNALQLLNLVSDKTPGSVTSRRVGMYRNGTLSMSIVPMSFRDGKPTPLRRLESVCKNSTLCPQCGRTEIAPIVQTTTMEPLARAEVTNGLFVYSPQPDALLIPAVMPLHEQGRRGMDCGPLIPTEVQDMEGLLWAVEEVNADPVLLPGISLGAVIIDSCSHISEGLSHLSTYLGDSQNQTNNIVAVMTSSGNDMEAVSTCQVGSRFGKSCIATRSRVEPKGGPSGGLMARTTVPESLEVEVLANIISSVDWGSVALVYSADVWGMEGSRAMRKSLRERKVCVPLELELSDDWCSAVDKGPDELFKLKQRGTYGVVLWLSPQHLSCFFRKIEISIQNGLAQPGDFTWLVPSGVPDLQQLLKDVKSAAVGGIFLDLERNPLERFKQRWNLLNGTEEAKDPWLQELRQCKGSNCPAEYHESAHLLNTVNAVYSISYALDELRKRICGLGSQGLCQKLRENPEMSSLVGEALREISFVDPSGHMFRFDAGLFGNHHMSLWGLISTRNGYELRKIGSYHRQQGLILPSPLQGFQNGLDPFNLRERISFCSNCTECAFEPPKLVKPATNERSRQPAIRTQFPEKTVLPFGPLAQASDDEPFYIAGLFPIHDSAGKGVLGCGDFNPSSGFQQLAAFLYAIQEVNQDPHVLPAVKLSSVLIDTCNSEERAVASLFDLLSEGPHSPDRAVGVFGLEEKTQANVGHMLRSLSIPQLNVQPVSLSLAKHPLVMGTVPPDDVVTEIMQEVVEQMRWAYVSVVYEDSASYSAAGKHFIARSGLHGTCIGREVMLSPDAEMEDAQMAVRQLVLAAGARAVVLFVSNEKMLLLMEALSKESVAPARFIFLSTYDEDWTYDRRFRTALGSFTQGLVSVEVQRHNNTKFVDWLDQLSLQSHDPIPTAWFHEFWQEQFKCHIPDSPNTRKNLYTEACSGNEELDKGSYAQSPTILPTLLGVHAVARGLERFLTETCPGRRINSLSECQMKDPHRGLARAMVGANFSYAHAAGREPIQVAFNSNGFLKSEFSVRNLLKQDSFSFQYEEVGIWRPETGLILDSNKVRVVDSRGVTQVPNSICEVNCHKCPASPHTGAHAEKPQISDRFKSVWGIAISSMAGLGMLVCVICGVYFAFACRIAYGTTVCGYLLLFGVFLVYGLSLLFIFPPTTLICSVRRLATGVAWAFVFAPLLVKAAYSWMMACRKARNEGGQRTSPFSLLTLTLGLAAVQIVIGVEWIVLDRGSGLLLLDGEWRCPPGEGFERALVFSLPYVLLLIALTTLFSLLGWQSETHRKENRWIFLSCLFTIAIWITWTLLVTMLPLKVRDPALAISMASNATIILLCIFMRKAYFQQKHGDMETYDGVYQNARVAPDYGTGSNIYGVKGGSQVYGQAVPALPPPNGLGLEPGAIIFQNSAYDGGSEFNPSKSDLAARSDMSHRF